MKKGWLILIMFSLLVGCSTNIQTTGATKDDINISFVSKDIKTNKNTDSTIYVFNIKIENKSDKEISVVKYYLNHLDENGEVVDYVYRSYYAANEPLMPGKSITDEVGYQLYGIGVVKEVEIVIDQVLTAEEEPVMHLPEPGDTLAMAYADERLNNLSTQTVKHAEVGIDQMGVDRIADFDTEKEIEEFIEAFNKITIGEEGDEFVTDNYNWIAIEFKDGSVFRMSMNLYNLEIYKNQQEHIYTLNNLKDLWTMAEERAVLKDN